MFFFFCVFIRNNFILLCFLGKAILHTASAMILHWGDDESNVTTSLISHKIVTSDERDQLSRLIVTFVIEDQSKVIGFFLFYFTFILSPWKRIQYNPTSHLFLKSNEKIDISFLILTICNPTRFQGKDCPIHGWMNAIYDRSH